METKPERMSPPCWWPEDPPLDPPRDGLRSPPPAHSPAEGDEAPPPADPPPTAYATPPAADPPPDGYPAPPPEDPAQEVCAALPPNVRGPYHCPLCELSFSGAAFLNHQCQTESHKRAAPGKRHPGDAVSKKSRQQPAEPRGGLPAAGGEPPALGPAAPASPPAEPPPSPDVGESSRERVRQNDTAKTPQQYEDYETKEGKMSLPGSPPDNLAAEPPEKPPPPPEDTPSDENAAPRRHLRERPYYCSACDARFASLANLGIHFESASHKYRVQKKEQLGPSAEERRRQQLSSEGAGRGQPEAEAPPPGPGGVEQQYKDFDAEVADHGAPPPDPTPNSGQLHGSNSGDVPPGSEPRPYDCEVSFSARKSLRLHCKRPCHEHTALPVEPGSKRSWPSGRGSRITGALPAPEGVARGRPPELRPTAPAPPPRQPPPEPPLLWGPPPEQPPDIGNSHHTQVRSSQRLAPADSGAPAYSVQSFRCADTYERQQHAVSGAFEGLLRRLLETDTSEQPFALQTRHGTPQSQQEEKRLHPQQERHSLDLRHLLQQQQFVPGRQLCRGSPSLPAPVPSARGSAVANTGSATGQSVPPFCNGGTKGNSRRGEQQNGPQKVINKTPSTLSLQQSPSVPAGSRRLQPACPDVTIRTSEQVPLPLWAPAGAFSDGPRICPVCGGAFLRGYSLREHVRCFHPGSEYFECEVCGVAFAVLEEYRAHLAEYAGIGAGNRHPADECPKSITNATHPARHEELNSRDRPYLCDGRPDRYRNEECPARRERLHAGEGRFQCDECPEHFSAKTILKRQVETLGRAVVLREMLPMQRVH